MSIHDDIRALLEEANEMEREAQQIRRDVGRMLVRLQAEAPTGEPWLPHGMDERSARHLIQLAAGGNVREANGDA